MEYPHRLYVMFLLSRRLTDGEIAEACRVRMLQVPTDLDLHKMRGEVGPIPDFWMPTLSGRNMKLYRWVRDLKVMDLWKPGSPEKEAGEFIYATTGKLGPRTDFQHLMLLEWDVEKARDQLVLKYGSTRIPSLRGLEVYAKYFWNLPKMTQGGIFDYLESLDENSTEFDAYSGNVSATYGFLGLKQQIKDEEFYDDVVALAHAEVQMARKTAGRNSPTKLMAIAGLAKVADNAIQARRDLRAASLGDRIQTELAAFRLRKRNTTKGIPSYEDLVAGEVEEGNVISITAIER